MPDPGFWRGRRVLLTGHTGFKGAWLALWLDAMGAEVVGFSGPPPSRPSLFDLARVEESAQRIRGDVRDGTALFDAVFRAEPEIVFHLAAQAIVRKALDDPVSTFSVNVDGTAHLLEAVRGLGDAVRAVVVVTSDKCYRNDGKGQAFREDDPLGGKDPYSASKAAQEWVASSYRDSFDLPIATARAGNVIGGGDWGQDRLVADFMRAALAGEPLVVRAPEAVRPWQHVLNPLSGYLRLAEAVAEREVEPGGFNFGPDESDAQPVSWLVERLGALWPEELVVEERPDAMTAKEAGLLRLDSTRAREELGWTPGWDLEQGLRATVEWFDAHRRGEDMRTVTRAQVEAFGAAG